MYFKFKYKIIYFGISLILCEKYLFENQKCDYKLFIRLFSANN